MQLLILLFLFIIIIIVIIIIIILIIIKQLVKITAVFAILKTKLLVLNSNV